MRKLSRSKNTKSWESQLGAWSGYSPCLLSPSEGLGSWSWREASPGIPQVLDSLNLHPSLSEEPRPVFPLWHGCDLQGLVSHVSPLLILDEDLVQHCCSWGGQGILQLPQEVGVHREQFLPQGKEEGRDGAEAWAQAQSDRRGESGTHAPGQVTARDYLLGKRQRGLGTCPLTSMLTKMVSMS